MNRLSPEKIAEIRRLLGTGCSIAEVVRRVKCCRKTIVAHLRAHPRHAETAPTVRCPTCKALLYADALPCLACKIRRLQAGFKRRIDERGDHAD